MRADLHRDGLLFPHVLYDHQVRSNKTHKSESYRNLGFQLCVRFQSMRNHLRLISWFVKQQCSWTALPDYLPLAARRTHETARRRCAAATCVSHDPCLGALPCAQIEAEAFGKMAVAAGYQPIGLPGVVVHHAPVHVKPQPTWR